MTRTFATNRFSPHAAHGAFSSVLSLSGVLKRLAVWAAVARQRRRLAELDEAQLRDIGLTHDSATHEAARPFWDTPVGWKREGHF